MYGDGYIAVLPVGSPGVSHVSSSIFGLQNTYPIWGKGKLNPEDIEISVFRNIFRPSCVSLSCFQCAFTIMSTFFRVIIHAKWAEAERTPLE